MAHFLFPSNRITQNKITNENILWVNKKNPNFLDFENVQYLE